MADAMHYFELNTGAKIPSLGFGTWQCEPSVCGQAVDTAIKVGYRHIDCAPVYDNEKEAKIYQKESLHLSEDKICIGEALKRLFNDGVVKREDLFITSKLWCTDNAHEDVQVAFNRTLDDLQLDYIDLYLIHLPLRMKNAADGFKPENLIPADIPGTWRAMETLYDYGKARAIGVSNFSIKKLGDLLETARVPPAVNQVECHPSWQQRKLREFCESKGVHLSGFSPLGSPGFKLLTGDEVLKQPVVLSVAEKLGKTPAQICLRWGVQMGHSVLPKSKNESRIKENFDIFDWSIPDDMFTKFSEIQQVSQHRDAPFAEILREKFGVDL